MSHNLTDRHEYKPDDGPEWTRWKGEGQAPANWYAVNPITGERTKVYRSYADYCDD